MAPTRLINTKTLDFEEPTGPDVKYAILSHRWVDEVTYQEWVLRCQSPSLKERHGYLKIKEFCRLVRSEGIEYAWVDTNCIDKTNSSELSEAINSMFVWYRDAARCYVYLHDLHDWPEEGVRARHRHGYSNLAACEWFTRGWTLQELLAPREIWFYSAEWDYIGSGSDPKLCEELSNASGIPVDHLNHTLDLYEASVAQRMSWAAQRRSTRGEDEAYCLLGLFGINIPPLYGEGGQRAFKRLQEEILKVSTDQTIFAWNWPSGWVPDSPDWVTLLAPSPAAFKNSRHYVPEKFILGVDDNDPVDRIYSMNNVGLSLRIQIVPILSHDNSNNDATALRVREASYCLGSITCYARTTTSNMRESRRESRSQIVVIPLICFNRLYFRIPFPASPFILDKNLDQSSTKKNLVIAGRKSEAGWLAKGFMWRTPRFSSLGSSIGETQHYFVISLEDPARGAHWMSECKESSPPYPGCTAASEQNCLWINMRAEEHIAAAKVDLVDESTVEGILTVAAKFNGQEWVYYCRVRPADQDDPIERWRDMLDGLRSPGSSEASLMEENMENGLGHRSQSLNSRPVMVRIGTARQIGSNVFLVPVFICLDPDRVSSVTRTQAETSYLGTWNRQFPNKTM